MNEEEKLGRDSSTFFKTRITIGMIFWGQAEAGIKTVQQTLLSE